MTTYGYDLSFGTKRPTHFKNNEEIIKEFAILRDYTKQLKQPFKSKAYDNAINKIRQLNFEITPNNAKFLLEHKVVGKKLYDKILEFLDTKKMKAVENVKRERSLNNLLDVKGFGPKVIEKLKKLDIYTYEDLVKNQNKLELNRIQKLGIKYYDDLNKKIPREDIKQIYILLYPIFKSLNLKTSLVGSFRRGLRESSDVDLVIGCNIPQCTEILRQKISKLPFYIDTLLFGKTKFSFFVNYKGIIRQVDILVVPYKSYYTAIFHFTGSGEFNEATRSLVKREGITINEYYILKNGKKYYPKSEKEIFDLIKVKYLPPMYRYRKNIQRSL